MRLPEKEYYFLSDLADKDEWDCKVDDLLHYGEIGLLEICVYIDTGKYVVYRTGQEAQNTEKEYFPGDALQRQLRRLLIIWPQDREKEYFPGDSCPILLKSEGWRNMRRLGHLQGDIVIIKHPREDAFISPVKRDYAISDLFVTYEEKLRFEAACDLASNTKATTHSKSSRRTRNNELHEVIWAAYLALEKRHSSKPTSGEVWLELKRKYKEYDTEEVIDEIKKGIIYWTNFRGSEQRLKENSFKGTLYHIKKKKNISKNSN